MNQEIIDESFRNTSNKRKTQNVNKYLEYSTIKENSKKYINKSSHIKHSYYSP